MARLRSNLLRPIARLSESDRRPPRLQELARAAGLSPYHLHRRLRRTLGEAPGRYSLRVRLQRAAAQLLATDRKVIEIALASGFETHEAFSRAFARSFGCSPSDHRRRHRSARFQRPERHVQLAQRAAPCLGLYRLVLPPEEAASR